MSLNTYNSLKSLINNSEIEPSSIDLAIHFCGYEARCVYFYKKNKELYKSLLVVDLNSPGIYSYDKNKKIYIDDDCDLILDKNEYFEFRKNLSAELSRLFKNNKVLTVLIDISSATRKHVAIFFELMYFWTTKGVSVNVITSYVFAKYASPPDEVVHASSFGPVTPFYSGWDLDPDRPITLVLGLGYEKDRSLSAIEYLEPSKVLIFKPGNGSGNYDEDINAESVSLSKLECRTIMFNYDVMDFPGLVWQLDSAVNGLLEESRVVLLPFGPKLFNVASILVTLRHMSKIHLYRVSGEAKENPFDRSPDATREVHSLIKLDERISER